jgi:hypothetical protein
MKILRGKEKLGEILAIPANIDWDDLVDTKE